MSDDHALALRADGTVAAWGSDDFGQRTVPPGLSGVTAVAAGGHHSLALRSNGTVRAWGRNDSQQAQVPAGLAGVVAVRAGWDFSIALLGNGTVVAWGANHAGQRNVPAGLSDIVAIAAGSSHALALTREGTVVAWGSNFEGEADTPSDLGRVASIAATSSALSHGSLAVLSDGTVRVWGGYLGRPFVGVDGLSGVVALSAGAVDAAAVDADGAVTLWNLFDGERRATPRGLDGIVDAQIGQSDGIAALADGTVELWTTGGGLRSSTVALPIDDAVSVGYTFAEGVSIGERPVVLRADGTAWYLLPEPRSIPGFTDVVAISASKATGTGDGGHVLGLRSDGSVVADGTFRRGRVNIPAALGTVTQVSAGGRHSAALRADGTVAVWLPTDPNTSPSPDPCRVLDIPAALPRATAVSAGGCHLLVLTEAGTVVAWGSDQFGQSSVPPGLDRVVAIAAGSWHSLALRDDGTVVGWGQTVVPPTLRDVEAIFASDVSTAFVRPRDTAAGPALRRAGQRLHPPAPNPASGTEMSIRFDLDASGPVVLDVLDVMGRRVAVLMDGSSLEGSHVADWSLQNLAAGTYIVRLMAAGAIHTRTVTVLR